MMRVTLFGTRGSVPTPSPATARYGGNTSTAEIRGDDDTVLVLDAGTGIRSLGQLIPSTVARVDILLTHLHMDHILGLGFFAPLYNPEIEVHIWGPGSRTLSLDAGLSRYLSPPLFPVHLRNLPRVACHSLPRSAFNIGSFRIHSALICHPDPTAGYRIERDGNVVTYMPDHEPALCMYEGQWPDPAWISGYELAVNSDLLIHDAQYSDEEYGRYVGFGHSSYRHAFEFATLVKAQTIVPVHHDPSHDDIMLDQLLRESVQQFKPTCQVSSGHEGAVFYVGSRI